MHCLGVIITMNNRAAEKENHTLERIVAEYLAQGRFAAVREVRRLTGWDFKDARDFVNNLR